MSIEGLVLRVSGAAGLRVFCRLKGSRVWGLRVPGSRFGVSGLGFVCFPHGTTAVLLYFCIYLLVPLKSGMGLAALPDRVS